MLGIEDLKDILKTVEIDVKNVEITANNAGLATESTLSSIDSKITVCNTDNITIATDNVGLAKEATLSSLLSSFSNKSNSLTVSGATTAQQIELDTEGRPVVEIYTSASNALDFYLDVSLDGTTWITAYKSWSGVTEVKEGYFNAFRYLRLRTSTPSAATDITLIITSAR